eukprot:458825-Amphidinium_carterae.2
MTLSNCSQTSASVEMKRHDRNQNENICTNSPVQGVVELQDWMFALVVLKSEPMPNSSIVNPTHGEASLLIRGPFW